MKKFSLSATVTISLVSTSIAFAGPTDQSGYYSQQFPITEAVRTVAKTTSPATDIIVNNYTSANIVVDVPNTPIKDLVYPNKSDHVFNNTVTADTFILIRDPFQKGIFPVVGYDPMTGYACHHAVIDVYGSSGSYSVYVNTRSCN